MTQVRQLNAARQQVFPGHVILEIRWSILTSRIIPQFFSANSTLLAAPLGGGCLVAQASLRQFVLEGQSAGMLRKSKLI